jgi:hypothetical protein
MVCAITGPDTKYNVGAIFVTINEFALVEINVLDVSKRYIYALKNKYAEVVPASTFA